MQHLAQGLVVVAVFLGLLAIRSVYIEFCMQFTENTRVSMEDLFVFIDPAIILKLNLVLLCLLPSFTWIITGAWPLFLIVAIGTAILPRACIYGLKKRRIARFIAQMPDALTMMSASLKAGASVQIAMSMVVNESPAPISQEFALVLRSQRLGMTLEDALDAMGRRMAIEEVDLFVSAVTIAKEVGGHLSEILERLSLTLRTKAAMEGKIRALTAQGKMQGWVVGFLPLALGMVLYTIDPESMSMMFKAWYGWMVIAVVTTLLGLGAFFIRKIVTIDI